MELYEKRESDSDAKSEARAGDNAREGINGAY